MSAGPAGAAPRLPLSFTIGARTLFRAHRRLIRVPLNLAAARAGTLPDLPPLPQGAHGYLVTSLPEVLVGSLSGAAGGMLRMVRQRYRRHYLEFASGHDAWFASLSGNTRQTLRRKLRRIEAESGGQVDLRRFRTPGELTAFHPLALRVSARTYQARLLGAGLPADTGFREDMAALAAADRARAWLLYLGGEPIAYLYCPIAGDTVIYGHVGHDPAWNEWSPGAVLQWLAMRDLFDEARFDAFDFTEGEGQHKRQFATGDVACVDLLLLRPTLANRALLAALAGFDRGLATAKGGVQRAGLARFARRLRRG